MIQKVAIVGATGVLGKHLVAQFQESGRAVRALARSPEKLQGLLTGDSEVLPCNLLRVPGSLLAEYLKGCDVVVHAATEWPLRPREKRDWEPHNRLQTEGTARLIEASLRAGVGFYLQQSTVTAYVDGGDQWQDEDTPYDITPVRAVTTLAVADMERRVRELPAGLLNSNILRLGPLTGPGTPEDALVRAIGEGREIVPGDGSHFLSPVHLVDAADAFVKASQRRPTKGVFNIVDEPIRYGDYVDGLADWLRVSRPGRDRAAARPLSHRCANKAAQRELGWEPLKRFGPDGAAKSHPAERRSLVHQ